MPGIGLRALWIFTHLNFTTAPWHGCCHCPRFADKESGHGAVWGAGERSHTQVRGHYFKKSLLTVTIFPIAIKVTKCLPQSDVQFCNFYPCQSFWFLFMVMATLYFSLKVGSSASVVQRLLKKILYGALQFIRALFTCYLPSSNSPGE